MGDVLSVALIGGMIAGVVFNSAEYAIKTPDTEKQLIAVQNQTSDITEKFKQILTASGQIRAQLVDEMRKTNEDLQQAQSLLQVQMAKIQVFYKSSIVIALVFWLAVVFLLVAKRFKLFDFFKKLFTKGDY